jgi:putative RecB family exonuclease
MPPRFSHSRLAAFENCPRQYRYRYIDRLPRPGPGIEAYMGICVHKALEFLYQEIHAGRPAPDLARLLARYQDTWAEVPAHDLRIVRRGFDTQDYLALGQHCLETYYGAHQPFDGGQVLDIEKKVQFSLDRSGRYPMVGYIDRLMKTTDGVIEIHDYKTSGSLPRSQDLRSDRQLSLYEIGVRHDLGLEEETPVLHVWHYLTFNRRYEQQRTVEQLRDVARSTMAGIRRVEGAQEFPVRTGILCHWCDFNEHCPEGGEWVANHPRPGLPS